MAQSAQNARTAFGMPKIFRKTVNKSVTSVFFIICKVRSRFLSTLVVWGVEHKLSPKHTNLVNCINRIPCYISNYVMYIYFQHLTFFAESFHCNSTGDFPDQNDCRMFYSCYRLGGNAFRYYRYTCPSHIPFYHPKNKACRSIGAGMLYYNITFPDRRDSLCADTHGLLVQNMVESNLKSHDTGWFEERICRCFVKVEKPTASRNSIISLISLTVLACNIL